MAVEANPSNLKQLDEKIKQQKKKEAKLMAEVNKVIEVLKGSPLKIGAKTGTSGKIFGSVTSVQLARAIRDQKGYEIDRRRIHILEEVKELGTYKAKVDFGNGNETEVEFEVDSGINPHHVILNLPALNTGRVFLFHPAARSKRPTKFYKL